MSKNEPRFKSLINFNFPPIKIFLLTFLRARNHPQSSTWRINTQWIFQSFILLTPIQLETSIWSMEIVGSSLVINPSINRRFIIIGIIEVIGAKLRKKKKFCTKNSPIYCKCSRLKAIVIQLVRKLVLDENMVMCCLIVNKK